MAVQRPSGTSVSAMAELEAFQSGKQPTLLFIQQTEQERSCRTEFLLLRIDGRLQGLTDCPLFLPTAPFVGQVEVMSFEFLAM